MVTHKEWLNTPLARKPTTSHVGKVRMFFYGQLKVRGVPDTHAARGLLRLRDKTDAAARFGARFPGLVYGQVMWISKDKLPAMDKMEAPEYKRVVIRLSDGSHAYAYGDVEKDWESEPVIASGRYDMKRSEAAKPIGEEA
jgi:gamma-glutamylcyclotransferase (GGCT)/AIG2-like uncharacterized protein YtfP